MEALATRLRCVDLVVWGEITMRAEKLALSFEDLRLLLALTTRDSPTSVSELARVSGLSLQAAYPAARRLRSRGYLHEEQRMYSLREEGRELLANLDSDHRVGIQAYVDGLDARDREWLEKAIRMNPVAN